MPGGGSGGDRWRAYNARRGRKQSGGIRSLTSVASGARGRRMQYYRDAQMNWNENSTAAETAAANRGAQIFSSGVNRNLGQGRRMRVTGTR